MIITNTLFIVSIRLQILNQAGKSIIHANIVKKI